jgi:hypothetical protein
MAAAPTSKIAHINNRVRKQNLAATAGPLASPLEFGFDYPGWDMGFNDGWSRARTPEECRSICARTADCAQFSFRADMQRCYTKRLGATGSRQSINTGAVISGSVRGGWGMLRAYTCSMALALGPCMCVRVCLI